MEQTLKEYEDLINKLKQIEEKKIELIDQISKIKDLYLEDILLATNENGKKKYSNQEIRDLELRKRLREDEKYLKLREQLDVFKLEAEFIKHKLELLKMKFKMELELAKKSDINGE